MTGTPARIALLLAFLVLLVSPAASADAFADSSAAATADSAAAESPDANAAIGSCDDNGQFVAAPATGSTSGSDSVEEQAQRRAVFSDGFERTGDASAWDDNSGVIREATDVASGYFSIRVVSDGYPAFARYLLPSQEAQLYYRIRFNVQGGVQSAVELFAFRTVDNARVVSVSIRGDGTLQLANSVIDAPPIGSAAPVSPNAWHELQLFTGFRDGSVTTQAWLDGVAIPEFELTAPLSDSVRGRIGPDPKLGRIQFGDATGSTSFDVLFDDVVVDVEPVDSARGVDPVPGVLEVQTVPALAGVRFSLDGSEYATDANGVARIDVPNWSLDLRKDLVVVPTTLGDGTVAALNRWQDWSEIKDRTARARIDLYQCVRWSFQDLDGNPVDPSSVTSVSIKGSTGSAFTFTDSQHGRYHLLHSRRVVPTAASDVLLIKDLYYTVDDVIVNGASVVHRSQQRITPIEDRDVTLTLLFYSAQVSSRDALFGYSIGTAVNLRYPDGTVERIPLEEGGELFLPSLPRGEYELSVEGAGYSPPRPVAVTRDQVVELEMVSYVDMASAALFLTAVGFGLLFAGRPELYRAPFRMLRRVTTPTPRRRVEGAGT